MSASSVLEGLSSSVSPSPRPLGAPATINQRVAPNKKRGHHPWPEDEKNHKRPGFYYNPSSLWHNLPHIQNGASISSKDHRCQTGLVHDICYNRHRHPHRKHPERPERVEAIITHLQSIGIMKRFKILPAIEASYEELVGVHNHHYLQRLRKLERATVDRLTEESEQYDSVYFNEDTIDCAKKAAGGLMGLVKEVVEGRLRNGLALIRPPGHHAEAHHARGFCVINNIAVAAQYARDTLGMSKILIVDWDVHHGNGTQHMFLKDPSILYFSVHRYDHGRFFPSSTDGASSNIGQGNGLGYTVNVAWDGPGMGDAEYMEVWRRVLMPIAKAFAPEIVLVSAGFDGALGDEMGGCNITPAGYGEMTRQLMSLADGKVMLALEGGYKLSILPKCVEACLKALMMEKKKKKKEEEEEEEEGGAHHLPTPSSQIMPEALLAIQQTIQAQQPYWPCLQEGGEVTA